MKTDRPTLCPRALTAIGVFGLAYMMLGSGCSFSSDRRTALMRDRGVRISRTELRTRMNDLAPQISGEVEELAITILEESDDPKLRHRTRAWVATVIPIVYRSATLPDPLAALIDTWVLCAQLRQALESGTAKDMFDEYQPQAVKMSHYVEGRAAEVGRLAFTAEQLKVAERNLAEWVEKYPIGDPTWVRQSTIPILASVIGQKQADAFSAVEDLSESIDAVRYEMNLYAEHLPKQARWLVDDVIEERGLARTGADVDRVATSLEELEGTVDDLPELLRTELARALEWAHEERLSVLTTIESLLMQVIEEVREEREIVSALIREERAIVLREVEQERVQVTSDLRLVGTELIEQATGNGIKVVDHLFWRIALLVAALALPGGVLAIWAVLRLSPRR